MAFTKRVTASQLKNVDLKTAVDTEGDKLKIDDLQRPASRYRDLIAEIKPIEEELKQQKAELIAEVKQRRLTQEKRERFFRSCVVATNDPTTLLFTFQDKYSAVAIDHESLLKRAFGRKYDDLFERGLSVKLKDGVTFEQMERAIGPAHMTALAKFLDFEQYIKLRKGFMETRAEMRPTLDVSTNNAIDVVTAQVQAAPQVRVREPKEE